MLDNIVDDHGLTRLYGVQPGKPADLRTRALGPNSCEVRFP